MARETVLLNQWVQTAQMSMKRRRDLAGICGNSMFYKGKGMTVDELIGAISKEGYEEIHSGIAKSNYFLGDIRKNLAQTVTMD